MCKFLKVLFSHSAKAEVTIGLMPKRQLFLLLRWRAHPDCTFIMDRKWSGRYKCILYLQGVTSSAVSFYPTGDRVFFLLHSFVLIKHVLPTGPQVSPYNHWKPWPGYHLRRLNCPEFSCLWMSDKVLARVTNLFASFFQDATAAQFTATATILGSYLPTVFVTRWRLRSTPPHGKHSETVIGWASAGSSPPLEQKHRNA